MGFAILAATGCGHGASTEQTRANYAGSAACAGCHEPEYRAWSGSLHAVAMQPAERARVRARFDGTLRTFPSLTIRPRSDAERLAFETPVPDGGAAHATLAYVLGRGKIEQFLTPTPGGRLQALPVGWDTRRGEWFDIAPDAPVPSGWDHWSRPGMTANTQCLPCHATGYEKGYRAATDDYATRWNEMGVGCESCHGPGAAHVRQRQRGEPDVPRYGAVASRTEAMATCAPCHDRRLEIGAEFHPGEPLDDFFDRELLDTSAFHADGQPSAEVYEWTSFQMSRMAGRGVVCGDCHDPHATRTRAAGDALCLGCHAAELATVAHTHHPAESAGARCTGCHMPVNFFMQRDDRHDHQLARPDPETAATIGAPDPCTRCHADRGQPWATDTVRSWGAPSVALLERRKATLALDAGRRGDAGAAAGLIALLATDADAVRRASAARLLAAWLADDGVVDALLAAVRDPQPLVRASAVEALAEAPADDRTRAALLEATRDPLRLVRVQAAFGLRAADLGALAADERSAVGRAFDDWLATQDVRADAHEAHYNRGIFLAARGDLNGAEAAYRGALSRWPDFLPARQNLALLLADAGRDGEAEEELRALLERDPSASTASFALGLLYARQDRWGEAAGALEWCVATDPSYPRARYNLGVAYGRIDKLEDARAAFERAAEEPSSRADALRELVRLSARRGDGEAVSRWLPSALRAAPETRNDPRVESALEDPSSQGGP